jgi:ABC-2 type transport system ATP-binding protein
MDNILSLHNVVKNYHNHKAVDEVSFDVKKGTIFGLLGPNGAGKTSLIRIITTITGADSGEIYLDGEKLNLDHPSQIGYMPEERGLYKKMKVGEQLLYLAQLKGLSKEHARKNIQSWMEKFAITDWWNKKIEELSKGMQQKIQFIATVMHDPKLLILDEPFSGLDPVNTNLIKDEIREMHRNGKSIIFSTHRMEQVEGNVAQIKNDFKENIYRVEFKGQLPSDMPRETFEVVSDNDDQLLIKVKDGHNSNEFLKTLIDRNIIIKSYQEILPTINQIFIKQVEN